MLRRGEGVGHRANHRVSFQRSATRHFNAFHTCMTSSCRAVRLVLAAHAAVVGKLLAVVVRSADVTVTSLQADW